MGGGWAKQGKEGAEGDVSEKGGGGWEVKWERDGVELSSTVWARF